MVVEYMKHTYMKQQSGPTHSEENCKTTFPQSNKNNGFFSDSRNNVLSTMPTEIWREMVGRSYVRSDNNGNWGKPGNSARRQPWSSNPYPAVYLLSTV